METQFLWQKGELLRAYKIYSQFIRVKLNILNLNQNWEEISQEVIEEFITKWKTREEEVLKTMSNSYFPWGKGVVEVWLFPNFKILSNLPHPYRSLAYTFKGKNNIYISLPFVNQKIPYWLLIHELFHANDLARGVFGKADPKKHAFFFREAKRIGKEIFPVS